MTDQPKPTSAGSHRFTVLAAGLFIVLLLLLPPVKSMVNRIPYIWHVLYPLILPLTIALTVRSLRAREHGLTILKWGLLALAGGAITVHTYGGPYPFFILARVSAILFLIAEVGDVLSGNPEPQPQPQGD